MVFVYIPNSFGGACNLVDQALGLALQKVLKAPFSATEAITQKFEEARDQLQKSDKSVVHKTDSLVGITFEKTALTKKKDDIFFKDIVSESFHKYCYTLFNSDSEVFVMEDADGVRHFEDFVYKDANGILYRVGRRYTRRDLLELAVDRDGDSSLRRYALMQKYPLLQNPLGEGDKILMKLHPYLKVEQIEQSVLNPILAASLRAIISSYLCGVRLLNGNFVEVNAHKSVGE